MRNLLDHLVTVPHQFDILWGAMLMTNSESGAALLGPILTCQTCGREEVCYAG
jgi:hypothetical protein